MDCLRAALDLICYEMHRGTLSRESVGMLADHLGSCPVCRAEVDTFLKMLLCYANARC
jgi:hypothetical protein